MIEREKVLSMDISAAYALYNVLKKEQGFNYSNYHKIRFGIKIMFDIYKIIDNHYFERPRNNQIVIRGIGMIPSVDFNTEVEERETLIKKAILSFIDDLDEGDTYTREG